MLAKLWRRLMKAWWVLTDLGDQIVYMEHVPLLDGVHHTTLEFMRPPGSECIRVTPWQSWLLVDPDEQDSIREEITRETGRALLEQPFEFDHGWE